MVGPNFLILPSGTSLVPVVVFDERHDMIASVNDGESKGWCWWFG